VTLLTVVETGHRQFGNGFDFVVVAIQALFADQRARSLRARP